MEIDNRLSRVKDSGMVCDGFLVKKENEPEEYRHSADKQYDQELLEVKEEYDQEIVKEEHDLEVKEERDLEVLEEYDLKSLKCEQCTAIRVEMKEEYEDNKAKQREIVTTDFEHSNAESSQRAKKEHAVYNREGRKTGGGNPPPEVSEDSKRIIDMLKDKFKDPGCDFESDNVKPSSTQSERSGSSLCTVYVGDSFEMDELPELTNHHGQSSMISASSTPLHKSTVNTSLYNDGASCSYFTALDNFGDNGNMQKQVKIPDWLPARASTAIKNSVGKAVLSPLENNMDLSQILHKVSTANNVMSKSCMKKRKRQAKFENTPDIDVESDNQRGPSVNPKTGEGTTDRLYDLLIAEAQKRVKHYEILCQEYKIRSAHTKEKQMLERRLLKLKIKQAEEQLEQTRKGCGKSYF